MKEKLSWYETSLVLLASAQNLIDPSTDEFMMVQVEIGRNKRLIAIQKNYIKGVWRQDAEEIEKLVKEEKI